MRLRVAAIVLVLAVAGCSSSGGGSSPSSAKPSGLNDQVGGGPFAGVGLIPPRPRPQFTLTDTAGKSYSFGQQTQGRTTLLFFGYTNCPDVCPATMADIGVALRSLPSSVQKQVTVAFVSTDVKRDTGAVITRWLHQFEGDSTATFVGLRGTQAQVDAAQAAAHVTVAEDGGQTHSTGVMLYGPDDYAHVSYIYNDNGEDKQMAHDIPLVVKGQV